MELDITRKGYLEIWLDGGAGYGTYYLADGIHPNEAGQTLIANAVMATVKTQLGL